MKRNTGSYYTIRAIERFEYVTIKGTKKTLANSLKLHQFAVALRQQQSQARDSQNRGSWWHALKEQPSVGGGMLKRATALAKVPSDRTRRQMRIIPPAKAAGRSRR